MHADRLSGGVLIATGLFAAQQGLDMGLGHAAEPGGGFMPVLVGLAIVACGARLAAGARAAGPPRWPAGARRRQMLVVIAATVAYFALVDVLGFLAATALFLAGLLRWWGRYAWWLVAALTVTLAGGLWVVFGVWLRNPLPRGLWG